MHLSQQHKEVSARVCMLFNIPTDQPLNDDTLHQKLTEVVVHYLLNQMEQLLAILYRVDVNEHKIKEAFSANNPTLIAPKIASLIIERELQKAESRASYRK